MNGTPWLRRCKKRQLTQVAVNTEAGCCEGEEVSSYLKVRYSERKTRNICKGNQGQSLAQLRGHHSFVNPCKRLARIVHASTGEL